VKCLEIESAEAFVVIRKKQGKSLASCGTLTAINWDISQEIYSAVPLGLFSMVSRDL
jgi:hypothetical protein